MKTPEVMNDGQKIPHWILVGGAGVVISAAVFFAVASVAPKAQNKTADQVSPVMSAEANLAKSRADYLQMILAIDVDPKTPGKAGVLQTILIQRSAEQVEYANLLRKNTKSKFFGQRLEVVLYQLEQMNNQRLIEAQRGQVNEQRFVLNLDGSKTPYTPTSTVLLGQAVLDAAAFQMTRLEIARRMTPEDVNAFLVAQKNVTDNLALLLEAKQDTDVLQQFQELQLKKLQEAGANK